MIGNNGDYLYNSSENALLEFFSKAGSLFVKGKSIYNNREDAVELFKPAFYTDKVKAMKLLFWLRNCRGGSGNRSAFRSIVKWITETEPDWIKANIDLFPSYGRWDDLESCFNTSCENQAIDIWVSAILNNDGLACKWVPREKNNKEIYKKIRKRAKMSPGDFRKHVSKNTEVAEKYMCSKEWYKINYNHVPSVCMSRNAKAFLRNDAARFESWKKSLEKKEDGVKVNASVLFPHDIYRMFNSGDSNANLANAQFDALPDYIDAKELRIIPICDSSGSMTCQASGSIRAIDVCISLGLYVSDRIGKDNPFYRTIIPFSETARLVSWKNKKFTEAIKSCFDGYIGSTNIKSALDKILESALIFGISNDKMPNCLLILSDMQFNQGTVGSDETVIEKEMKRWESHGYSRPKIIYWNLNAHCGSPATADHKDVCLISGFSPSILKSVLANGDMTPVGIMNRELEKYSIKTPETIKV